jgi:hypothetical protein
MQNIEERMQSWLIEHFSAHCHYESRAMKDLPEAVNLIHL